MGHLMNYLANGEAGPDDLWQVVELVDALGERYEHLRAADDADGALNVLDEIVALLDQALADGDAAHPVWPILMTMAIEGHGERLGLTGDPADQDETIRRLDRYLNSLMTAADEVIPVPGMPVSEAHRQMACLLGARYEAERDRADLDLAIAHARQALRLGSGSDSRDPEICWILGNLLADRYLDEWPGETASPADRDEALSLLTAVAVAEEPDKDALSTLVRLANDRLIDTSDRADRDVLIKWGEQLLLEAELGKALTALTHGCVGLALKDRAEYAAEPKADLAAAIHHLESELELTPPGEPDRWMQLMLLVGAYWDYLGGDDSQHATIDRMTELAIEAWPLAPPGTDERAMIGLYLVTGLYERSRRPGDARDLARIVLAMDILTEIEPLLNDPDIDHMIVVMMMTFKVAYAQLTGSAEALREAEPWVMRALDEVPPDDPQWAVAALNLSLGLAFLASMDCSVEMTDNAADVLSAVLRRPGIDPVSLARIEGLLGVVLVQRASFHGRVDDLDRGIAHLRACWEVAHQDDAEHAMVAINLGSALLVRYTQQGDRQDLDVARWYVAAVRGLAIERPSVREETVGFDATVAAMAGMSLTLAGHADRDLRVVDAGVAELRSAVAALPAGSPHDVRLRNDLGLALLMRATLEPAGAGELDEILDLLQAGRTLSKGNFMRPLAIVRLAGVLLAKGTMSSDPAPVTRAIGLLTDLLDELGPDYRERPRYSAGLGMAYRGRYDLTRDRTDIKAAIGWLEQARDELLRVPGHPVRGAILIALGRCYRLIGDLVLARRTGLAALRERGQDVLLQTGTARGLRYADLAASESAEIADWCLADGEPCEAVAALELGRGLVLHAATVVTGVGELLDQAGQTELANRWRASVAASTNGDGEQPWDVTSLESESNVLLGLADAGGRIPDDLRARVLRALAGAGTSRLTDPPSCADIATAVAETGADALVYLLEPTGDGPGYAIILPGGPERRGEAIWIELPLLARGRSAILGSYITAYTDWVGQAPGSAERWRQALDELCDWAWPTVMAPLLDRVRGWAPRRVPRLVLVPVGRLSVVPWQAARSPAKPDLVRFACTDAVISYAASGRLLIEVSRRAAIDLQAAPVIVGDPARRLPFAAVEAEVIAAGCYPASRYLGQVAAGRRRQADGRGTPAELLAELPTAARPGASVLHLGCHVRLVGSAPPSSYLELAGGEHLTIETILRQAGGRPAQAPGGLVSLAACVSDYGVAGYDEALSLATAFLAGGAVTVASARWFIDDDTTTLLMFMFHYFMTTRAQSPRDALRLAQLWMLDPGRTAPAEMPAELAKDVPRLGSVGIANWAAFTHQGR